MISQPAYTEDSVNNSPCLLKTDVTDGHFQEVRKNISISFSSKASINSVVNSIGSHQESDVLEEVNKDVQLDVIMGNSLFPGDVKNQMKDKFKSIPSNIKEEEKTGVATKSNNGEYISKFIRQKPIGTILADDMKDDLETLSDAESEEFNQTFHSSITVSNTLNSEELDEDFTKQNGLVITGSESPTFDSPLLKYLEENIRNKVEDTTDFCGRNEEIPTDKNVNELRNELFKNENVQPILNDNISSASLMKLHPHSQHEVFTTSDESEHVLEVGSGLQFIEVKEDTTDITGGDKNNKLVPGEEEVVEEEEEENECQSKKLSTTFNEMTLLNSNTLNDKEVSEKWLDQVEGMSPVSNKVDESCNVETHADLPTHKVLSDSLSVESAIVVIRDVCSLRGSLNDSVKVYEAPGILPCVDTLKCVDNVVNIVSRIDASKDSDETRGLMLGNSPNTYKRDRSSENDEEKKTYERGIRNGICNRFEQQCLSSDEIITCESVLAREEQPMKAMGNNDVRDNSVVPIEVDKTESKQESEESEPKADHSFPDNTDYGINEFKIVETNQPLMQSKTDDPENAVTSSEKNRWTKKRNIPSVFSLQDTPRMKEDDVSTNEHDVATKENNVATKEDDLGSNENDVGSNENDVFMKEDDVGSNENDVGLNENDVGSNENDVFMKEDDVAVGKKNTDKYNTSDLQPSSELDNMIVKNKEIVGEQDSHDTHDEISTVSNGCPEKKRNNTTELVEDVEITMSIEQVIHVINDGLYEINDDSNENVALFARDCVPMHCDVTKEHGVAIDDGTSERVGVPVDGVPEEECVAVDTIVLQKEGVLGDGCVPEEEHALVADDVLQDESFPVDDTVSVEKHFPVNYDFPKEVCAPQDDGVSENKYVVIDDGEPRGKSVQIHGCMREEELVPANASVVEKFYVPIGEGVTAKRNATVNGIVPRDERFLLHDHFHEKDSEKDSDIFEKERVVAHIVPKKKGVTINDGVLGKDDVPVNGSVLNKEYTAQHVDVLVLDGLPTEKNKRMRDINRISHSKPMENEKPITNRNIQCNSKQSANCEVKFDSKLPADSELSDDVELRDDGKLRIVGEPLVGKKVVDGRVYDGIHKDSFSPSNISKANESTESFDKYESVNIFTEKEKSVKNAFSVVDKISHKPFDDVRTELKKGKKDSDNRKYDPFKVSLRSMIGDKKTSYNKDVINHTSKPETVIPAKLSITSSPDIKSKVPPTSPIFTNENKQTSKQKLKKLLQKKIGFSNNLEKSSSQNKEKRCFEDFSKNNSKHLEDSENISKIVATQLDECKNDSVLSRVKISLDNNKDCDVKSASCPRKRKVPSLNVSKESPKKRRKSSRIPKRKQYKEYKVNMRFKNNENFHNISNEDLDCRDDEFRLQLDESSETVCPVDVAREPETNPTNSQCFDVPLTSTSNERPRESVGTFIKPVETKPANRFTPVNRRRTTSRRSNPANQQSMIPSSIQDSEPMRMTEISKVLNEFKDLAAEYTRSSSPIFDGEESQCDSKVGIPGKISSTNDFTYKSLISHVSKFGRKRKRKRDRCSWTSRRRKKDKNAQINFERTNSCEQNEQLQTISERLDDLLAKQDLTQLPLIGDEMNNVKTTDISLPTTSALKCRQNLRSFVDEKIIESSTQQLLTSNSTFNNFEFSNRHSDLGRDLKIKLTSEKDRHTGIVRWSRSFETREKESIEKPPSSNYGLRKSKTRLSKNLVKTDRDAKRRRMTISDMPSNLKSPDTLLNLSKRPLESYIKQIEDVHYSDKKTSKGVLSIDMKDRATKFSANTHDSCDYLRLGEFDVILEIARKTFRDSNIKNYRSSSRSLYVAAKQGKVLQVLVLSSSCNVNATIPQEKHKTAMHAAAAAGHVQVLKILSMVGGNVSSFDTSLRTPLFDAVEHKKTEAVKFLINHTVNFNLKDSQGMTILHFAAQKSSVEIINLLLETRKVDINEQDNGGWTALMWTAEGMRKDAAECLLKWGANVNILDNEQNTCLHWAALAGDVHIMELLLNKNVHVDAKNVFDATALHISAREEKLENIKILSKYRPNLNIQDVDKKTPIELVPVGSPCHIQLKNMELLQRLSKCSRKQRLISRDISRGLEKRPIPCINEIDDEDLPEHFVYVSNNLESQSQSFVRGISGCNCSDGCSDESACDCVMLSYPKRFWYNEAGLINTKIFKEDRPYVYECNMKCKCWSTCRQRVVQHGINVALQLFKTAEKGWAVRTQELIPKGTFVCEYIGEILTDSEANQRDDDSYLFDLDLKGQSALFCLDAKFYGNITRFINHSCDPNILPVRVFTDHQVKCCPRIAFFAARDIHPYEEICSNYGEKFWTVKKSEFFCLCKTSKCKYGLKKDISGQSVKRMK